MTNSRFIKILTLGMFVLTITFAFQAYSIFFGENGFASDTFSYDDANIKVNVGEMYFEQKDSNMSRNELRAEVGDIIGFYNEGSVSHTVTIPEYDFDEVIHPGDSVALRVTHPVNDALVNCRFHIGHDALLTVTGDAVSASDNNHTRNISSADVGDLPVRSTEDSVDLLDYELVDGVKEFHLTVEHIIWEYADGVQVESWAYNGQLPGPEIRVTEGDDVRIVVTNNLPVSTSVHWHGLDVPIEQDGVPGITQDPIKPGETFTYEFTAVPAGTRFYHTHGSHHGDEGEQLNMGLAGPFVIEPENYVQYDREYTIVLSERIGENIFPINGKIYPNHEELEVSLGDGVRIRMINAGATTFHPMHLHGHQFRVIAADGNPIPVGAQQTRNTLPLHPGETYDIEFVANNPGEWLFHCHELQHAAGGMIATVVYK